MKARAFIAAVCVVMMIAFCAQQSSAQAAPGVYADATHPAGPPDPTKLDSIWQVDPLTGSLSVTIPFTTTPTGGRGPKIPFTLHYNSASTVTLQGTGSVSIPGILSAADGSEVTASMQVFTWGTGNLSNAQGPLGPWTTSGPFMYSSASNVLAQNVVPPPGPPDILAGCWIYGPYIYTDESGAAHDMNLELTNVSISTLNLMPPCQNAASASQTYGLTYFTTDGSALATNLDGSIGVTTYWGGAPNVLYPAGNTTYNGAAPNVLYPDGTQFYSVGSVGTLEDSNGNMATFMENGNTWTSTDSLGRTAFSTTLPIDYVGQIPVGTYNVKTYGATGNTESYSVVFTQTALGSFTMQHPVGGVVGAAGTEIQLLGFCGFSYECPTAFMVNQVTPGGQGSTLPVVSSITLPDSTQYAFTYDPTYGTISKIVFPTGGYVRFVWGIRGDGGGHGQFNLLSTIVVTEACTSTGSGNENCWQYNLPSYSPTTGLTSKVTAPDGSYTAYTGVGLLYDGVPLYQMGAAPSWKEASRLEYSSTNKLLRSVANIYNSQNGLTGLPLQVATTLDDGPTYQQQVVQYKYDSYANVTEKDESDFNTCTAPCTPPAYPVAPTGGWLRRTFTSYAYATSNPAFVTAHIVNKPYQVLVTDGSGNPYSLTQYGYDETLVSGSAGIVNHDDKNYPATLTLPVSPPRGNLTTEGKCVSGIAATFVNGIFTTASCGSTWLNTTHSYDLAGQMLSTTDPRINTTTFSYTDNYVGVTLPWPTDGYVTTVTQPPPFAFQDTYSYYYNPGQLATHTDWNGQTTKLMTQYYYNDPMNRPTKTIYPDTGNVQIGYDDATPPSITVTTATGETSGPVVRTTQYDGLGRVAQTQLTSDPGGPDYVETTYDSMGRVQSVTNPFRTTSDPTYGITSYLYDGLSRKIDQCQPDNSSTPTTTCSPTNSYQSWTYSGNCVVFQDENKNQWQRCSNGLGQLTSVLEPNGASQAPSMVTNYVYDPLNNLRSVAQLGGSTATGITRNRTFTYDSLSRLLCASNPENSTAACPATSTGAYVPGTTGYTYDADGNVITKTDARSVTTTYQYDNLNRLLSKTYSDGATPLSCYQYGSSATCNTIGRLTNAWTQSASSISCSASGPSAGGYLTLKSISCYDPMGRPTAAQQQACIGSKCSAPTPYSLSMAYDLAGNMTSLTNPVGAPGQPLTLNYYFDAAARPCLATSTWSGSFPMNLFQVNPATSGSTVGYAPFGGLQNWYMGSSSSAASTLCSSTPSSAINITQGYTNRLWANSISATGQIP
jgi:YD repeat-containing protein